MSAQDSYHGTQDEPKNLATMDHITRLEKLIAELNSDGSGLICWPDSADGAKLNNPSNQTEFTVLHTAMTCKDVCVYDSALGQWVGLGVEDVSTTQTKIIFGESPDSNRYCVFIRGVPVEEDASNT